MLVFGATGMVGQRVLRECLLDPVVELVVTVGRTATGARDAKLREIGRAMLAVAKRGYGKRVMETVDIRAAVGR
jgi:uncharacterized protein YbjT (DUF2867 family)